VNNREVFGHWEADTIIGKAHKGVIVTLDNLIAGNIYQRHRLWEVLP
jgi:IS30 family transposase